mgnify:CR=1 FL=1
MSGWLASATPASVRRPANHLEAMGAPGGMVLEERLEGREFSVHVLIDGADYKILPMVRDYERLLEGDKGPNTAGIGSVAVATDWDRDLMVDLRLTSTSCRGARAHPR